MSLRTGKINRHRPFACPEAEYGRRASRWEQRRFSPRRNPSTPSNRTLLAPAAPPRLIDTVDYIISVSGGGYTAGARLLATQRPLEASDTEPVHKAPDRPLLSQRFEQGSAEFDHFRRGSSYIAGSAAELVNALAVVLRNLIASLGMLFTVPAILGWAFGYLLAVPWFSFATFVPVTADGANQINHNSKCAGAVPALADHHASWWAVGVFRHSRRCVHDACHRCGVAQGDFWQ